MFMRWGSTFHYLVHLFGTFVGKRWNIRLRLVFFGRFWCFPSNSCSFVLLASIKLRMAAVCCCPWSFSSKKATLCRKVQKGCWRISVTSLFIDVHAFFPTLIASQREKLQDNNKHSKVMVSQEATRIVLKQCWSTYLDSQTKRTSHFR